MDFSAVGIVNFIVVIFSFLFVDIFDTLGTLIGVATKAKMLDKDGKLPGIKPALLADSIATSAGAILVLPPPPPSLSPHPALQSAAVPA